MRDNLHAAAEEGGSASTRLVLLDGFRIGTGDVEADLPHNAQRLVAHLGLSDRPDRSLVAGALWPDVTERRSRGSLRSTLWRIQRSYPGLVCCAQRAIFLAPHVSVDVRELRAWARRTLDPGRPEISLAPDVAFSSELLPGWYDDWVLIERDSLHQLRLNALEVLAQKLTRDGRLGEALEAVQGAASCEPLRESAHRLAIEIHLAQGNAAAALQHFDRFASALRMELGLEPSERLMQIIGPVRTTRGRRGSSLGR